MQAGICKAGGTILFERLNGQIVGHITKGLVMLDGVG